MIRALAAGGCLTLSAAPTNVWPLAVVGLALLYSTLDAPSARRRAGRGLVAGLVLFTVTLRWTSQFNVAGSVVLVVGEAAFLGLAALSVPVSARRGRVGVAHWQRAGTFVAAFTVAELLRVTVPFGGFQLGNFTTGMAGSPLAPSVSIVGEVGLVAVTGLGAVALVELVRATRVGLVALVMTVSVVAAGSPDFTREQGMWPVTTVQAGGPQALLRDQQDPDRVFADHLRLTQTGQTPGAIVWPENVVSVFGPVDKSLEGEAMATLARQKQSFLGAGVVESTVDDRFRNSFVVWAPDGAVVSRYEKVLRVPFGEYVPGRAYIERFVDLSQVPSDAFVGRNVATVKMGTVDAAVAISYEGLFSRRIRDGVRAGGEVILVPTNAASYESTRVSRTQVQAARLRAMESGRAVVQAAPTGISAFVTPDGSVRQQSRIGVAAIQSDEVPLATGRTPFITWGHVPLAVLSGTTLALMWGCLLVRRRRDRVLPRDGRTTNG